MEIERINENTVKFYISYIDIEDRGFEREEIWYNRERSEQLFWQMMDEVNYKEDFPVEGPLWIQVQALEKGLEIIVTKAQVSKNGENLELPIGDNETIDITVNEKIENMLEKKGSESKDKQANDEFFVIVQLNDFEDVIQLSHYVTTIEEDDTFEALYYYDNKYYLYLEFSPEMEERQEDLLSQLFEFGEEAKMTIHVLNEYGKLIMEENVFQQIKQQFNQ